MGTFRRELIEVLNKHSKENGSNTPDFILAEYLIDCLKAFDKTLKLRESWYGRDIAEPKGELLFEDTDFDKLASDLNHNTICARTTLYPGKEINEIPQVTADELRDASAYCQCKEPQRELGSNFCTKCLRQISDNRMRFLVQDGEVFNIPAKDDTDEVLERVRRKLFDDKEESNESSDT